MEWKILPIADLGMSRTRDASAFCTGTTDDSLQPQLHLRPAELLCI